MEKKLRILIQKCIENDSAGQRKLYTLLSPKVYGICLKYMKNKTEADDVFQEAFIILFQKIHQYKFKGSFEGWAKRIFINEALQRLRKRQHHLRIAIDDCSKIPNSYNENNSYAIELSQDKLLRHIQQLPDKYRMVFNLYVLEGYRHKEIASELQIAVGTSRSLLSRAKSLLKLKISEEINKQVS